MRNVIILIAFNLCLITSVKAARKIEGYIIYNDNRSEKVTFLIPFGFLSSEPAYLKLQTQIRYLEDNKKVKLLPTDAKEISFSYNGVQVRMLSVTDNLQLGGNWSNAPVIFLKLELDGAVRLFDYYAMSYSPGMYSPATGMMTGGSSYTYDRYVLQRDDGELVRPRGISFRKDMAEFFADCPELVDKINARILRKSDLKLIVEIYNKGCN